MDKVWLYVGGILVVLVVAALVVLNSVRSMVPPADDLRAGIERTSK